MLLGLLAFLLGVRCFFDATKGPWPFHYLGTKSLTPPMARSSKILPPLGEACVCVTLGIIGILSDCFSFTVAFLV